MPESAHIFDMLPYVQVKALDDVLQIDGIEERHIFLTKLRKLPLEGNSHRSSISRNYSQLQPSQIPQHIPHVLLRVRPLVRANNFVHQPGLPDLAVVDPQRTVAKLRQELVAV